jgi:hypothetical protein
MILFHYILTLAVVPREASQNPVMEHRKRFEDIRQLDSTVRYSVKFNGSQKVSERNHVDASERIISRSAPEYSFVEEKGTVLFQIFQQNWRPVKCRVLTDF